MGALAGSLEPMKIQPDMISVLIIPELERKRQKEPSDSLAYCYWAYQLSLLVSPKPVRDLV